MKDVNSMPAKPALKGEAWTGPKRKAVKGRFVLVGFIDGPAMWGLVGRDEEEVIWEAKRQDEFGAWGIDSPSQVISIGPVFTSQFATLARLSRGPVFEK